MWKDYDDLESSLSMPEFLATLEASRERTKRDREFSAAIQGIDMAAESADNSFEEVRQRAHAKAMGNMGDPNDIINVSGAVAEQRGFGIGHGLGYEVEND